MAIALATAIKNARLDQIETEIGTSAILKIRTGTPPGIGNADSGDVLVTMSLPSDWMAAASGGQKAKSGTWQDTSADGTGTAGHFRIYKSDGTTQMIEGTAGESGDSPDLVLDNKSINTGQQVTITSFTLTDGN
jgi:hypothetical protein